MLFFYNKKLSSQFLQERTLTLNQIAHKKREDNIKYIRIKQLSYVLIRVIIHRNMKLCITVRAFLSVKNIRCYTT